MSRKYISSLALLLLATLLCSGKPLRVAFVGDPQVDNARELAFARKSVLKELSQRKDIDLGIFLGDIVNDAPELMEEMKQSLDSLPFTYFCIKGNHDDGATFDSVFSYRDTSFARSGVNFILLDNSSGKLTDSQIQILKEIKEKKSGRTVVCTHIPLKSCRDSSYYRISGQTGILLVSAHLHRVFRTRYPDGVEEIGAGASCGSWWRGPMQDGIPYALMNCGAPRGYFIADFFKNGDYWLSYKAIGRPDKSQASISHTSDSLYVNVWGGSPDGKVSVSFVSGNRRIKQECVRTNSVVPEVLEVIRKNSATDRKWRKEHREEFIPLRKLPSSHLWVCPLQEGNVPEKVDIRYMDKNMKFKQRF